MRAPPERLLIMVHAAADKEPRRATAAVTSHAQALVRARDKHVTAQAEAHAAWATRLMRKESSALTALEVRQRAHSSVAC